ncbi:XRE family transcriptional regulator [bacterium]|nr:XRE family transcriptional regulator [bacterium]
MSIGSRLKQVRLSQGLTLDELAIEMGGIVTKQALSKYEREQSIPSPRVMTKLASSLGVKAAYFQDDHHLEFKFHGFRRKAKLTLRDQEQIQSRIQQELEFRIRLQRLTKETCSCNLPIHGFVANEIDEAEVAATTLRELWGLGKAPVASVTETLEECRIHVIEVETDNSFDGLSATVYDEDRAILAAAVITRLVKAGERQRFNLLHELGHLVLKPTDDQKLNEKMAFRFASAFLAPKDALLRLVGPHRSVVSLPELLILKKRFGMSVQAILYRLKDLGVITPSHYRHWCMEINKCGYKQQEPYELPREEPQWLQQTLIMTQTEGLLSTEEAQKMLKESISPAESSALKEKRAFMRLPIEDRRRIIERQAKDLAEHYSQSDEWRDIEGADIIEY